MTVQAGTHWADGKEFARIRMIPADEVGDYWNCLHEFLQQESKTWKRYWTLDGIYSRLQTGHWQLWLAVDKDGPFMAMITEVSIYETGEKDLIVHWLGGLGLRNLDQYFFIAEEWARQYGCDEIITFCRPGVKRLMEKYGFRDRRYTITKAIRYYKEN